MATPEQARIADALGTKFRDLQQLVNELAVEASLYQSSIEINDDSSRMVFQALTRASALAQQMEVTLNLMSEDLRVIEAGSSDNPTLMWRDYLRDAFDEHCCYTSMAGPKVH